MHRVASVLFIVCFFWACDLIPSQTEEDFDADIRRIHQMFEEFYKIPVKQKSYGNDFVAWKDQAQLKFLYDRLKDEISAINQRLLEISKTESNNVWQDDAVFCRAVLHVLWTSINPKKQTIEQALSALKEFAQLSPEPHLEGITKTTVQDAFLSRQEGFLSPKLSYEDKGKLALLIYSAQLLVKLREYEKAIEQVEFIRNKYPMSGYSQHYAAGQIQALKELTEGKSTFPDIAPEG